MRNMYLEEQNDLINQGKGSATVEDAIVVSNAGRNISSCPEALAQWYCLNGATCFEVRIGNSALYNCWCLSGYHGLRCDYKYGTLGKSSSNFDANETLSLKENVIEQDNSNSKSNYDAYQKLPLQFITRDDMIVFGRKPLSATTNQSYGTQQSGQHSLISKLSSLIYYYNIPLVFLIIVLISIVLIVKFFKRNQSQAAAGRSSRLQQVTTVCNIKQQNNELFPKRLQGREEDNCDIDQIQAFNKLKSRSRVPIDVKQLRANSNEKQVNNGGGRFIEASSKLDQLFPMEHNGPAHIDHQCVSSTYSTMSPDISSAQNTIPIHYLER